MSQCEGLIEESYSLHFSCTPFLLLLFSRSSFFMIFMIFSDEWLLLEHRRIHFAFILHKLDVIQIDWLHYLSIKRYIYTSESHYITGLKPWPVILTVWLPSLPSILQSKCS